MFRQPVDPDKCFYVYELRDPRNRRVFYVGRGSAKHGFRYRLTRHVWQAKRGLRDNPKKTNKIMAILNAGLYPEIKIFMDGLTAAECRQTERELIEHRGLRKLTNLTDGGEAVPSGDKHWTRAEPEKITWRGDNHHLRKHPEGKAAISGDNHWTRRYPEKVLKGDEHPWNKDAAIKQRVIDAMQAALRADPSKRPHGESHGMAKLTLAMVTDIRDSYVAAKNNGKQLTGQALAKLHGITPTQVSRILRGGCWDLPSLIEHHGNRKITDEQLAAIPGLLATGLNQRQVAESLGLSNRVVNRYAKRLALKNV
jgi:hypothetical protein